jgi:hypothetical protein
MVEQLKDITNELETNSNSKTRDIYIENRKFGAEPLKITFLLRNIKKYYPTLFPQVHLCI